MLQFDLVDWLDGVSQTEGPRPKLRLVSSRRVPRKIATPETALLQLDLLLQAWDQETITWSDADIATLREGLLRDALQTILDGRAAERTRQTLWEWLMSDTLEPFSFRTCCQAVDVHWEEMRESFVTLSKRHAKRVAALKLKAV